jgi:hypothetical protein
VNLFKWIGALFGSSDKGVVEQVNDTVERWKPSPVKEHEMKVEQTTIEDKSQESARAYEPDMSKPTGHLILDIFNTLVDCANRLPRPAIALWATCQLFGVIPPPTHLSYLDPLILNIVWTVIGFYFGIRTISRDIPELIRSIRSK